jgi:hypothetical protein
MAIANDRNANDCNRDGGGDTLSPIASPRQRRAIFSTCARRATTGDSDIADSPRGATVSTCCIHAVWASACSDRGRNRRCARRDLHAELRAEEERAADLRGEQRDAVPGPAARRRRRRQQAFGVHLEAFIS